MNQVRHSSQIAEMDWEAGEAYRQELDRQNRRQALQGSCFAAVLYLIGKW